MDKIYWIYYTQLTADALDSFVADMNERAWRTRFECVDLLGKDQEAALMKKGEAMAYDKLRRAVEMKLKEEIDYERFREQSGQTG